MFGYEEEEVKKRRKRRIDCNWRCVKVAVNLKMTLCRSVYTEIAVYAPVK